MNHWKPDGTCDCPMDGKCHECGAPCNDHDLVGNQIELGFPVYWCSKCTDKACEEMRKKDKDERNSSTSL